MVQQRQTAPQGLEFTSFEAALYAARSDCRATQMVNNPSIHFLKGHKDTGQFTTNIYRIAVPYFYDFGGGLRNFTTQFVAIQDHRGGHAYVERSHLHIRPAYFYEHKYYVDENGQFPLNFFKEKIIAEHYFYPDTPQTRVKNLPKNFYLKS